MLMEGKKKEASNAKMGVNDRAVVLSTFIAVFDGLKNAKSDKNNNSYCSSETQIFEVEIGLKNYFQHVIE